MARHHFICYSSIDGSELALRLSDELVAGPPSFAIWLDERELLAGEDRDTQIAEAIRTCDSFLFLMTRESVQDRSVCKQEWVQALKYKKPVMPLLMHADAEMPFRLGARQPIEFASSFERGLAQLRRRLRQLDQSVQLAQRTDPEIKRAIDSEHILAPERTHDSRDKEVQSMTGLEPIAITALTKAVDFLFDQAGKLMDERRIARKARGDEEDVPTSSTDLTPTRKEEILSLQPKNVYLKDIPKEVDHCLGMIHQYRDNKRRLEATIAAYNGFLFAPGHIQYQLRDSEDQIKHWCQELKDLVGEAYGHEIVIIGLN